MWEVLLDFHSRGYCHGAIADLMPNCTRKDSECVSQAYVARLITKRGGNDCESGLNVGPLRRMEAQGVEIEL